MQDSTVNELELKKKVVLYYHELVSKKLKLKINGTFLVLSSNVALVCINATN